jgi:hypothetical protein
MNIRGFFSRKKKSGGNPAAAPPPSTYFFEEDRAFEGDVWPLLRVVIATREEESPDVTRAANKLRNLAGKTDTCRPPPKSACNSVRCTARRQKNKGTSSTGATCSRPI